MSERFALGTDDVCYVSMPLFHSNAVMVGWAVALACRGSLALRRKFSASHFWDDIADNDCTIFVYIGELCRYLVNQPPHPKERGSAIWRYSRDSAVQPGSAR